MKKSLFGLLFLFLITSISFAQDSPKKAQAKAGRALGAYNLDQAGNEDKLHEAKGLIEIAAASSETNGSVKTWQVRGEIFNSYADKDIAMMSTGIDPEFSPKYPDAPLIATESFEKALELAEKKYEIKDALTGLSESVKKLNQIGNLQIQSADYSGAFRSLYKVLQSNDLLIEKGEEAIVNEEDMSNHKFVVAFCAKSAEEYSVARKLFKELYDAGTDEPSVYAEYYDILSAEKSPDADRILKEGRAKFPENSELLFAKINDLIQKGENEKLKSVLEEAIKVEPNNATVRLAAGNVCMNLFTDEYATNGDSDLAKDYFQKSMAYFDQAIEIDPTLFDAAYSIGSLYFNKAVEIIKVANELPLKEAKKYDVMTKEATGLMERALPYFEKAESMNANDMNTLIALSEIFARMNEFDKSTEFKKRLEVVKASGTNESSYFDN